MKKAPYKLGLKKDDIVQVISGKEKGKKGKLLSIFQDPSTGDCREGR